MQNGKSHVEPRRAGTVLAARLPRVLTSSVVPKRCSTCIQKSRKCLKTAPPDHNQFEHNRHLDSALIHNLATHPAIIKRMASLYGPDLLLWRTNFFIKEPGAKEIPWHQDFNYWPLEPPIIISAWIAVDSTTLENSCLQIVPGSHRKVVPHVRATSDMAFNQMGDLEFIDTSTIVNLEMQPGEFVLFNERTLHHSEANRSDKRRIGLAVRVILPIVKVFDWDAPEHNSSSFTVKIQYNLITGTKHRTSLLPICVIKSRLIQLKGETLK